MKKMLLTLSVLSGAITAQAYDYPYLTFETGSGAVSSISVSSLSMTVSNGQLVATNSDGSVTFTLSDLSKMYFSAENVTAGISEIKTSEEVEAFTLTGISLGRFASIEQAVAKLKSGVYVIKSNTRTLKIAVK